jgi:hypothetical protein
MGFPFLITLVLAGTLAVSGNVAVGAQPVADAATTVPEAPIGHLQPRAQRFSPGSPAERVQQQKMSAFDDRQQKLDEELDKRLNICRC